MPSVFTDVGKNWVADKMRESGIAAATVFANRIAWGTGATVPTQTSTVISTETTPARATATMTGVTTTTTGDTFQAVGTLTADAGKTITNAGLFDAATTGDLVLTGDHAGVPLLTGDSIEYTFKLQFKHVGQA